MASSRLSQSRGPQTVLVATVTAGAGHLQAARALSEAWASFRPKDRVELVDVLDFTPKLYRKMYAESYVKLVKHAPELWAVVFKTTDNPALMRKLRRVRKALAQFITRPFRRRLKQLQPAVALCTHFLPLELIGYCKTASPKPGQLFTVSVVTDFEAHALWMDPAADLYCVAAEETAAGLVARGIDRARVAVTGIPISLRFSRPLEGPTLRRWAGLRDDLPLLLVLGGGFGMGPLAQILEELNRRKSPAQIVMVCGRNEELRRALAIIETRHPTRVLGFVDNMQDWLAAADLVVSKPGGLTTSEALALGKPLLILNPIPGQEAANSDFLLEHGAAVKINRVEDLSFRLDTLLGTEQLARLSRNAARLGRPKAALDVCREVHARLAKKPQPLIVPRDQTQRRDSWDRS